MFMFGHHQFLLVLSNFESNIRYFFGNFGSSHLFLLSGSSCWFVVLVSLVPISLIFFVFGHWNACLLLWLLWIFERWRCFAAILWTWSVGIDWKCHVVLRCRYSNRLEIFDLWKRINVVVRDAVFDEMIAEGLLLRFLTIVSRIHAKFCNKIKKCMKMKFRQTK